MQNANFYELHANEIKANKKEKLRSRSLPPQEKNQEIKQSSSPQQCEDGTKSDDQILAEFVSRRQAVWDLEKAAKFSKTTSVKEIISSAVADYAKFDIVI